MGKVFLKAIYQGYTDDTFTELTPQPGAQGMAGPTMHGEVGDLITVVFMVHTHPTLIRSQHAMPCLLDFFDANVQSWCSRASECKPANPSGKSDGVRAKKHVSRRWLLFMISVIPHHEHEPRPQSGLD